MRKRVLLSVFIAICLLLVNATATAEDVIRIYWQYQPVQTDVPPQIINGRVMIPIRAVAEAFGLDVNWDPHTRAVFINKKPPSETLSEPKIIGPDNFVEIIQSALSLAKEKDPAVYNWICGNITRIMWEENPTGIYSEAGARINLDTGYCYISSKDFTYVSSKFTKMETATIYVGVLTHEATHMFFRSSYVASLYSKDDIEAICDLAAYRAVQTVGTSNQIIKKLFETQLKF